MFHTLREQRGDAASADLAALAAHAANAPGHVRTPRRPTGTEQGQERGGGNEQYYTAKFRNIPPPQAAGTEYFSLAVEDVPAAGSRLDRLFAVSGPRDRVQRRTAQQIVDIAPLLILDDPAPQMVEQLPDVLRFFRALSPDPGQIIEVPTFLPEDVSLRTAVREPQLVEQLVEVPTIVSWSLQQQILEQIVDNPVPRRRFRGSSRFTLWTEFNIVF